MNLSPRPWTSHELTIGPNKEPTGNYDIRDASGDTVAEYLSEDDANHIVDAVNIAWEADCE